MTATPRGGRTRTSWHFSPPSRPIPLELCCEDPSRDRTQRGSSTNSPHNRSRNINHSMWLTTYDAGNPPVRFDVTGAGDGAMEEPKRARSRKRRIQPRPVLHATAPALDPTVTSVVDILRRRFGSARIALETTIHTVTTWTYTSILLQLSLHTAGSFRRRRRSVLPSLANLRIIRRCLVFLVYPFRLPWPFPSLGCSIWSALRQRGQLPHTKLVEGSGKMLQRRRARWETSLRGSSC
jgi:hypothetical protein